MRISSLILIAALFFAACGKHVEAPKEAEKGFCLSDTLVTKVVIDTVKMQLVKDEIKLSGKVTADEDKIVKVFPVVGGRVEQLKVSLGDYVTKGQTLVVIRSGEIADYSNQLSTAQYNLDITKKNMETTEDMFKSGLKSQIEVLTAHKEYEKAQSELARIQEVLKLYGSGKNAMFTVTAPASGYIIEKSVTENMQFRAEDAPSLFTIADLNEVWVMANVFETDIARIKEGYEASISLIAYPDRVFKGKVDKIFNILDPQSKVMKVRIRMPNPKGELKPEMFAQISIGYTGTNKTLAIPSKSIIFSKNRNYVIVYTDKCHLESREVELLQTVGGITYINNGLKEGEKIVSKYQLLIFNALND